MSDLSNLISQAVAAKMTPEFIEKEVDSRVEKLVVESIDKALRSYSDTGKMIEAAVQDALKVNRLDLPSYGEIVTAMLKTQIERLVAPVVSGRLAQDMEELLKLAPAEIKLSEIAESMLADRDGYGEIITVKVEHTGHGSTWIFLDEENVYQERDKFRCKYTVLVSSDGKIASARLGENAVGAGRIGPSYGLDQRLRAYVACGTRLIIDEDYVCTSVGDY